MNFIKIGSLSFLVAMLCVGTDAAAQYSPSASMNLASGYAGMASRLGASQLGREMMQREHGHAARNRAPQKLSPADRTAILSFRLDRSIARDVNKKMGTAASQQAMDDIGAQLETGEPLEKTRQFLQDIGWEPDNIADVIGAYTLLVWQLVHDRTDMDMTSPEAMAVRDNMRRSIAAFQPAATWSNTDKAEMAVFLTNMTALYISSYHTLAAEGTAAEMKQFQDGIQRTNFLGLDLRAMRLTRTGFVDGS